MRLGGFPANAGQSVRTYGGVRAPSRCPLAYHPWRANARPIALPNLRRRSCCNGVPKDSCVLMWEVGRKERTGGWALEGLGGRAGGTEAHA